MAGKDDVLLKLVIQGMDPAEVIRLANQTSGQLAIEMGRHFKTIADLHARMRQDIDSAEKKSTQEQIKDETKRLEATKKVYDDLERTAKRAINAQNVEWRRMMEHLENITTVAEGVFKVMEGGWHKLEQVGETIIKQTQIYNALTGSIEQMREATHGEVADIDLIASKNRGVQKELQLTDEEYGIAAKTAKKYADSIGIGVKESLDSLIDGLADGRVKMLHHVGIMVNAEEAAKKYAEAHGLIAEKLTEEQRLHAIQEEAIVKMTAKTKEFGEEAVNVASALEMAFAAVKNAVTGAAVAIGNIRLSEANIYSEAELERFKKADAMVEARTGRNPGTYERMRKSTEHATSARDAVLENRRQAEYEANFGEGSTLSDSDPQRAMMDRYGANANQAVSGAKMHAKKGGKHSDGRGMNFNSYDFSNGLGENGDEAGGIGRAMDAVFAGTDVSGMPQDEGTSGGIDAELESRMKAHADKLKITIQKAGGSFFHQMLFGPDDPDGNKLYEDMDEFQKASVDSMGMVSDAGSKMADALGASLAATIAGGKGAKMSIRDTTHAILESLAAQALSKAIFETAEGFAALALGPIGGWSAAQHFAAAGMFASVGVSAGIAARAVGQSPSGASSGIGSSGSAGSGGFGSGHRSSNANDNGNAGGRPIVINVSGAIPGSEAEVGRQIAKALNAHAREAGGDILEQRRSA